LPAATAEVISRANYRHWLREQHGRSKYCRHFDSTCPGNRHYRHYWYRIGFVLAISVAARARLPTYLLRRDGAVVLTASAVSTLPTEPIIISIKIDIKLGSFWRFRVSRLGGHAATNLPGSRQ
jgi:hypothetical protein